MRTVHRAMSQLLVEELAPCVRDIVIQPQIRRFAIGRTSNLERRARRQDCDGLITLHSENNDRVVISELETALSERFGDHPKHLRGQDDHSSQDSESGSRYLYIAVWYRQ